MITDDMYTLLAAAPREACHALPPEELFRKSELRKKAFDPAFSRLTREALLTRTPTHICRYYCGAPGLRAMAEYEQDRSEQAIRHLTWRYGLVFLFYGGSALLFALWMLIKAFLH